MPTLQESLQSLAFFDLRIGRSLSILSTYRCPRQAHALGQLLQTYHRTHDRRD